MTEKENKVRQCELMTRNAESLVREAVKAMEYGSIKAKAELARGYEA